MKLPFIISIPHGGALCPPEVENLQVLSAYDLFDDMDPFTNEIYDISDIATCVKTDIARAFIDLNRPLTALPPQNPDGIVKSTTCYQKEVYKNGLFPQGNLFHKLIDKYYHPFHNQINQLANSGRYKLILDCHSMAEYPPPIAPDTNTRRPLINLGDFHGKSCNRETTLLLKKSFLDTFKLKDTDVSINQPFAGGYITQKFGNKPIPCIQIEMNRFLYLSSDFFDTENLSIKKKRLIELNSLFREVINRFYLTQK